MSKRPYKLFISQPMTGLSDDEILAERQRIYERVKSEYGDVELVDSFLRNTPAGVNSLWCLGRSIEYLAIADCIAFSKNWDKTRGCRIEHACALEYGITILGVY